MQLYPYCINYNHEKLEYYNAEGRLAKIVDRRGFETLISYADDKLPVTDTVTGKSVYLEKNQDGKIIRVSDGIREAALEYLNGYLIKITDVNGNSLKYSYDASGRIVKGVDSNNVCYFEDTYDTDGRVIKQRDGVGSPRTVFEYSSSGENFITTATNRNGHKSVREFNSKGMLVRHVDENENVKTYAYDQNCNLTKETDALERSVTTEYNSFNKPTEIIDKLGNITRYEYDGSGNVTRIIYPQISGVSAEETFKYNSRNQVVEHTDVRGTVTVYTYDENGLPQTKKVVSKNASSYVYQNGLLVSETDEMNNTTSYEYDSLGLMKAKTDANGNKTSYEYDSVGNVIRITDAKGNSIAYSYDGNCQKTSSTDANGNVTAYTYNGNMKLTKITYPNGSTIEYEYDNEDRPICAIDQLGNKTVTEYDPAGRAVLKKLPNGAKTRYVYDKAGNVIQETTPLGAVITKSYDANGNVVQAHVEDNDGNPYNDITTLYEYDAMSRLVKTIKKSNDSVLNTTENIYSQSGELLSEILTFDGETYVKTYSYDAYGNRLSETDARGNTTAYTYDERNNLLTVTDALGNTTASTYNSLNQLEKVTNARGAKVRYGYDELGRRTTVTDAQGNTFTTEYDANGNVISTTDPYGNKLSESEYNSMNLPSAVTDPSSGTTKYTYDSAGNPIKIIDSANNAASYVYNSRGFTEQVIDPIQSVSRARYDESGNITELCGPLGAKTSYTYDSLGRKLSESTTSSGTVEYHYNSHGLMSELTNGRNQSKSFEYDSIGRIKSSTAPEGITEYTYDANGNVLTVKNELGTITRTFDALNRVKTYTDSRGNTVKYEYDEVGNLIKLTYPDNTAVEYTYDLNNNLTKVTDWAGRETVYSYDKNNRLIEAIKPNGIKQVNIYNEKQRLTSIKETSEAKTIISGYSYGYDLLGRVNFEKPLASIHAVCYTYDAVSRIISNGLVNTENSTISYREAFNYSPAGNIRTVYHNGAGTYEYDTQNKLTSFRDTSFTYDADGNMLTSTLGKFAFDSSNRLINTQTNSGSVTYTYDAEGTRIKSECGEDVIAYTYDVNARLSKLLVKTEGNVTTKYVYGLGLIGEETDGEFKTYHFDLRGSTVAITDENCNVTDTFEYDTYGKLISRTGESKTPFLYNGSYGVMTEASGLCYMRARYYSPVLKRFINADIVSGDISNAVTLNRYAFANCNPVSNVDPFGLSADDVRGTHSKQVDVGSEFSSNLGGWYTEDVSNAVHTILDVAGFIPGLGSVADALNAVVYAFEGDWANAGMSAFSALPGLGDMAAGCKWAAKFFKKSGKIYKALDSISTFLNKVDDFVSIMTRPVDEALSIVTKNADEVVEDLTTATHKSVKSQRKAAVKEAWENERKAVAKGKKGKTREWLADEIGELINTGKVKGYQGHHMKSVKAYPELAGDPNNIQFLTRSEHLKAHGGNWRNPTHGKYTP